MSGGWKKVNPDDLRDDLPGQTSDWYGDRGTKLPSQADRSAAADPEQFIREIKGMLVGGEFEYARDTLEGILATVEKTQHVTQGQWQAVDHIAEKPSREYRRERERDRERDRSSRSRFRREYYDR